MLEHFHRGVANTIFEGVQDSTGKAPEQPDLLALYIALYKFSTFRAKSNYLSMIFHTPGRAKSHSLPFLPTFPKKELKSEVLVEKTKTKTNFRKYK